MAFDTAPTLAPSVSQDPVTRLALAAKGGDGKALDALLRALPQRLLGLVLRELKTQGRSLPRHEIDDVVEDLLVAAWRYDLGRFDVKRGSFLSFMRKRVAWRVGDAVRAHGRQRCIELPERPEDGHELEAQDAGPEERLSEGRRELKLLVFPGAVKDTLSRLQDAAAARAVVAYDIEGRALREVADELAVHPSNACRARQRGLRWLAENLAPAFREAA